jgi:hypothetical protein
VFRARVLVPASNVNLDDCNSTTLDRHAWNIQRYLNNSRLHFLLTQSNYGGRI